jgi:hypothetical protein
MRLDGVALGRHFAQLGAQRLHVGVDVALVSGVPGYAQSQQQLLTALHLFRKCQQLLQQAELQSGELERLATIEDRQARHIDDEFLTR